MVGTSCKKISRRTLVSSATINLSSPQLVLIPVSGGAGNRTVAAALSWLASSAWECRLEVRAGFYDPANVIMFILEEEEEEEEEGREGDVEEAVFADEHARRHGKVAVVRRVREEGVGVAVAVGGAVGGAAIALSRHDRLKGRPDVYKVITLLIDIFSNFSNFSAPPSPSAPRPPPTPTPTPTSSSPRYSGQQVPP